MKSNNDFNNPLVSIITPTYNSSLTIKRCIDSVINQTYLNWEMIITDDDSTDDTTNQIKSYRDRRIKLYKLKKNLGAGYARKKSIENSRGQFIAFIDSDDEWCSSKLSEQLSFMLKHKIDFSYTSYTRISVNLKVKKKVNVKGKTDFKSLLKNTQIYTSTVLIKRDAFTDVEMPKIRRRQDFAFWLKLLRQTRFAYGINKPYTNYYETPGSLSSNYSKAIRNTYMVYKYQLNYSRFKSLYLLMFYIFNAIKKRLF